ncbi:PAS domain-containing sensor histidine kinase [Halapricum salinum]|uniref:histidine kinase n=1 Tax=Halapricum salinum TaxID=1457250 RepID=A0A4D6HH48_9EURY|nr:PAS domain-containing sensor histidine kinase [Halapricum salinum]QCC52528.1 PAS domain-containing sensor histidine kinase [Halapricum salinum]
MTFNASRTLPPYFDSLEVGVLLHHPETGAVLDANHRLEEMYGYTTSTLQNLSVEAYSANTYSHSDEEMRARINEAANGHPQSFRWRIKRSDGELIWVKIHLSQIELGDSTPVLGEVRNVSAYTATSRRVNLLSRIIRHNLRNDVTVLDGYAEAIEAATDDDDVEEYARTIRSKATDLGGLNESVREIEHATIESSDKGRIRRASEAVSDVVAPISAAHPEATIDLEEETAMWVESQDALGHAVSHAVENAIVHAEDEPSVRVAIDESPNTGRLEIRIEDACPAIPQMELDAIDELSENTATSHGSGVGLFVMKWCIESLGGELKIVRNRPRGNVVHFYLPPKEPP